MRINNPENLVGKAVVDTNGKNVGVIDKTYQSWSQDFPGHFFGVKLNTNTRNEFFRGTTKLIPIYSAYIREIGECVNLHMTIDTLCSFWNKAVPCGQSTCPTDEFIETPVFDKTNSRIGTIFSWVEQEGTYKNYGLLLDPYLCNQWKLPYNTIMPIDPNYLTDYKNHTISVDKTLDQLREYWKHHQQF